MIELRSDTFTLPTQDMLAAAATAPLGDDVWGEDPTVKALEEKAAGLLGKEAGLYVSSGTQGNLIGILSHTNRGDEVIAGEKSHIFNAEVASAAVVAGVQLHPVPNTRRGALEPVALEAAIRSVDIHLPSTALICVENTQNQCGGAVLGPDEMREVRDVAARARAKVHLDGARIFNASVALSIPAATLAAEADSVTFCLSKGLSAPVGSVLCGSVEYVDRARKFRKMLGGGMRQAGIIAAPGLVALHTMVDRLAEDHQNARRLGEALAEMPGVCIDLETLQTNIVIADVEETGRTAASLVEGLLERGIKVATVGRFKIRLVTHRGVSAQDVDHAIEGLRAELAPAGVTVGA